MSFDVAADSYDAFMGRYSRPLATVFADFAEVAPHQRVLDVGCGPGALTTELIARVDAPQVVAVDPSPPFVAAVHDRHRDVAVCRSPGELLPFRRDSFDSAVAQLVVHFMSDPVAGLREMARVTRPGGVVAACVWDHATERGPLSVFWRAAHQVDHDVVDESNLAGAREGHLTELLDSAGLTEVHETALTVGVDHTTFDEWWEPFTLGVGPAGAYTAALGAGQRSELRERCRAMLGDGPFTVSASAWSARGIVPASAAG